MKKTLLFLLLILHQFCYSQNYDIETIKQTGSNESRINLVILPDGYQGSELNQFIIDATNFSDALFEETPYKEYQNYFNVHAIKVPSNESGANHPGTASDVTEPAHSILTTDNYFESTFDAYGIHRLLVSNNSIAYTVLATSFPTYDIALVLVNSPFYGGSGGPIAVSSLHPDANEIAIHELGHSFVNLIDEYYAGDIYANEGINMTQETNPDNVKWTNWMDVNGIGIYQHCCGGNSASWYRPHQNCKMRILGSPFCSVCTEGTIEKIHSLTTPVESYSPENIGTIDLSNPTTFNINIVAPTPNTLSIQWSLNGTIINTEDFSVLISLNDLIEGNNQLLATIEDTTSLLKVNNHENIHLTTISWNLNSETLSIDDISLESLQIKLFPNPTQDYLYFHITKEISENYKVIISDTYGKQLINKSFNYLDQDQKIQLDYLASGVYVVSLNFENGLSITKKIIKK